MRGAVGKPIQHLVVTLTVVLSVDGVNMTAALGRGVGPIVVDESHRAPRLLYRGFVIPSSKRAVRLSVMCGNA
jgi:hypothetical protein